MTLVRPNTRVAWHRARLSLFEYRCGQKSTEKTEREEDSRERGEQVRKQRSQEMLETVQQSNSTK